MKLPAWVVLPALLILVSATAVGQESEPAQAAEPSIALSELVKLVPEEPSATLYFQNRPIVVFRAHAMGRSPHQRVEDIRERLDGFLKEGRTGVAVRPIPHGVFVTLGGANVFAVSELDLDQIAGEDLEEAGDRAAGRLKDAVKAWHDQHDPRTLLIGVGLCVAGTVVFLLVVWLVWKGRRAIVAKVGNWVGRKESAARLGGISLRGISNLSSIVAKFLNLVAFLLTLLLTYLWVFFCLRRFPYTQPWGDALRGYILDMLARIALAIVGAIPGILLVIIIFFLARTLARMVRAFFSALASRSFGRPSALAETAQPTSRILTALIWLFALILAYPYLPGSGSDAFKGVSVFVGLMISLGATGLVGQVMSGLTIMYSRALRPGDFVRINDTEGTVTSVGLLSTKLHTIRNVEITFPNNVLVSNVIVNYTRLADNKGSVLSTSVTIGYGVPWRQVHALLVMAADRTPGLRKDPPPFVLQTSLSSFFVEYQLNVYLDDSARRPLVLNELLANIQDAFNEQGVQILSPHYESDPAKPVWVPRERWYEPPAEKPDGSPGQSGPSPA